MKTLKYEEFRNYVTDHILSYMPEAYSDAEVRVDTIIRPNRSYEGLAIIKDTGVYYHICNLSEHYERYRTDSDLSSALRRISQDVQQVAMPPADFCFTEYETIRHKLFIRLFSQELHQEYLKRGPYEEYCDLAVTAHIAVSRKGGEVASTIVTHEMLEKYGISKEQLFHDAKESSMELFPEQVFPIGNLFEMSRAFSDYMCRHLVVTNEIRLNGAAVLFYPGELERLAELVGQSYFIAPTSLHEVVISPYNPEKRTMMNETIRDLNRDATDPEDWLSDHVYLYDAETGELQSVSDRNPKDFS